MYVQPRFICWDWRADNSGCLSYEDNGLVLCPWCRAINDLRKNCFPAKRYIPERSKA